MELNRGVMVAGTGHRITLRATKETSKWPTRSTLLLALSGGLDTSVIMKWLQQT